ncbi:MAG: leucine-rich repeat protein [Eubacteriales bacterium]
MKTKRISRTLAVILCLSMLLGITPVVAFATESFQSETHDVFKHTESTLAPGIEQSINYAYAKDGKQMVYYVATADIARDDVVVQTSYYKQHEGGVLGMEKLTNQMAYATRKYSNPEDELFISEYYTAVAGVNGSFYNMTTGQPMGITYIDGVSFGTSNYDNFFAVLKDGKTVVIDYANNIGNYVDENGESTIWQAIAGSQWLVRDGEDVTANATGSYNTDRHSRTCIGITADGKVVTMMLDGRQEPFSCGGTMHELAQIMLEQGCVAAINLDGGGSATYAARQAGSDSVEVINRPSDGSERSISAGIIIASTAAPSDVFATAVLTAESDYVTPGSTVNVSAIGVSPAGTSAVIPEDVSWHLADSALGTVENGVFTSNGTTGDAVVQMVYEGNVVGETTIHVVIPDAITFNNATITVPYGKTAQIELTAKYGLNEVTTKVSDFVLTLEFEQIGTLDGLNFTAAEEGVEVIESSVTAALVANSAVSATAQIVLGKGSEVIVDFEDGTDNGFGLSYTNYNYYLPNSNVSVVTAENGKVHGGNYALALNIDYSNSLESGYQMIALYQNKQDYNGVGAQRLGMWMYIPDEYVGLWGRWVIYPISEVSDSGEITYASSTITGQDYDGKNGTTGVVYSFNESGWHYVSIDTGAYAGAALRSGYYCFQFYISDRDGASFDYYFKNQNNVNGDFTVYIDDITFDYSSVVDDREAPVFGDVTYATPVMSDAAVLNNGATIGSGIIDFAASVAENTNKTNYTGIDASTAKAYVDGNEVPATYSNGKISINTSVTFTAGTHTVKLSVCDKQGNCASIIRTFTVESDKQQPVKVVAHDLTADRILLGSIQLIDVVAADIANVQSVVVTLDLDNMSDWQLDHMIVAAGFTASYSLQKDENIATVTITRTGKDAQTGEAVLVSIPVRAWFLENSNKRNPLSDKEWTLAQFYAGKEFWPIAIDMEVDQGLVTYTDGTTDVFTGEGVFIWTEMWANYANMTATEEGKAYYNSWNGGHIHTETAMSDAPATCTADGYTGRTFCEVCNSVVDWGTTVPATGHTYDFVNGVLQCTDCGELFNGVHTDGKTYVDGIVVADGWMDDSYYVDGVKLTGLQEIDGYYYDFGDDGICPSKAKIDGFYYDEAVGKYMYFTAGLKMTGEVNVYPTTYFFDEDGYAISGEVEIWGYTCTFNEKGAFISATDSNVVDAGFSGTNLNYVLLSDGTLKVGGEGAMRDYTANGIYPAWVIKNDPQIFTSLVIGNGITHIGRFGFYHNPFLKSVSFEEGSNLKSIGWGAFGHNWRLGGITLPASLEVIEEYAFYECGELKYVNVEFGSKLHTIKHTAFRHAIKLETVFIPDSVVNLGANIFYNANPDLILNVVAGSIAEEYAKNNNIKYVTREGIVTLVDRGVCNDTIIWEFYSNGELKIIGNGSMTDFSSYRDTPWFKYANNIKTITIGKYVTAIGNNAFAYYYQNVTEIAFEEGSVLTRVGVLSFMNVPKVESIVLPDSVTYIGSHAFSDCFALENIYVPQGVTFIHALAFRKCSNVVLNVAEGTYAENYAITNGLNYTTRDFVYIPIASGTCGENVFWNIYENNELVISGSGAMFNYASHTEQPWRAYANRITKITIGKDITSIGNYAFAYSFQNVTEIAFEEGSVLTRVGVLSFMNVPKVESIVLPDSVTYIGSHAFSDCFALENIYVPQGVTFIHALAFRKCSNVVLNVAEGSYAEDYARTNNLAYAVR